MTTFSTNPYFIFFNVSSVILHSLSRYCFIIKKSNFTSTSKSVVTYIDITVTNISNNVIKQYYGITKTFKVLVLSKRNSLAELIYFFRTGLSRLSKLSLISRIYL